MNNLSFKKIILGIFSIVLQIGVAVIGLACISFLFYIHNWSFINAFGPIGTDSFSAYTYVEWINKFFPNVPFWYPLQGAGVSFIASYPFLAHYLVVLFHRITDISLMRSFNIVEFSAFFVTAVGIFTYCWTRLEYPVNKVSRQVIGIIAASLYLIAPITYVYAIPWGFYAETVSYLFTAPTLILLDYFIDKHFKEQHDWKKRFALLLGMVFFTLAFLTHFSTGVGLTHVLGLIIFGRIISRHPTLRLGNRIRTGAIVAACIFVSLFGLFAWRYVNFQDYSAEVAKGGFAGYTNPTVKLSDFDEKHTLNIKQVLGLEYYGNSDPRRSVNDWAMQPFIWILAAIGATLGARKSGKMAMFGIMAFYGLTTLSTPLIMFILSRIGFFAELFNARSVWTVYRMIVPILAAYGLYIAAELPFLLIDKLVNKLPKIIQFNWNALLRPASVIVLMTIFTCYAIFMYNPAQVLESNRNNPTIQRIGTQRISTNNLWKPSISNYKIEIHNPATNQIDNLNTDKSYTPEELYYVCKEDVSNLPIINSICQKSITRETNRIELLANEDITQIKSFCEKKQTILSDIEFRFCNTVNVYPVSYQLNPKRWPLFDVTKIDLSNIAAEKEFFSLIPDKPLDTRYDLSGLSGSVIMRSPLLSNASQTQVYINNLNLFSALWNYQSSVMYADQPINQKPGVISELAKYFGYEYIFQATNSPTARELFDKDSNWENTEKPNWKHFKNHTTLTTWTTKPSVLFIGNEKTFLYDQFFKTANLGIIPYDQATLFAGSSYVDDYSLAELKQFTVLFIEGYKYHNANNAYELLDSYVKNGGSLFIDTGWKYESPDWEIKSAPQFFPTNALKWKEAAPNSRMTLDQTTKIGLESDTKDIGLLTNLDSSWGISAPQDIREGAHVLLQSNNSPLLIAYDYGQGKVIWSGMNIIAHIEGGKNENTREIELLKNSLGWLLPTNNTPTEHQINVSRPSPDKILFTFKEDVSEISTLYWRESYYPKWHAYLKDGNKSAEIKTFRAGPRLTGMRLPAVKNGQLLTLQVQPTFKEICLNILGLLTICYLVLYAIGLTKPIEKFIHYAIWQGKNKIHTASTERGTFKVHENPEDEKIE